MQDEAGVECWAYTSSQFVDKAQEILKSNISAVVIQEVAEVSREKQEKSFVAPVLRWAKKEFPIGLLMKA